MKLSLIFAAATALASAAQAADTSDILIVQGAPTARVSYADLNLGSAEGRQRLASRIDFAATLLCAEDNIEQVSVRLERINCYRAAVTSGAVQMSGIVQAP